ncbi:shikimate kinase [Aurantimonas aggregata]|uniref:Shikimate kinase n=1 Tax=Aurantimonas aggregata TaxID=2047720 RepID=A0A6L9MLJ4_9HYPH|nr:shikimate kinase [Aurantimonas aggregata]NDV88703.1 shikimate kinase [Aurantimonas aggregata]
MSRQQPTDAATAVLPLLENRSVTLIGLMGAGKTTVGRKLANYLSVPFRDSDAEIETVSRMSVPELFEAYGEPEFRALEARVIARLAAEGPQVLATGGGAFMREDTRAVLAEKTVTVWLKADLETLMERVGKRPGRPLLQAPDPEAVMRNLMDVRYPVYAKADITVCTRNVKREVIAAEIVEALHHYLEKEVAR